MKSRLILAAGMLILASALGRAEEKPPANGQKEPVAVPAPAPHPVAPAPPPVAAPCCRPGFEDCCQKFQDWLTFCPQHTPCCGHCCGCSCTPSCPPLYTYFLDHCGYGHGHGHGCGCAAPPAVSAPVPAAPVVAAPAPCETCGGGFWHRLLGR
jgi:hypothetical protein